MTELEKLTGVKETSKVVAMCVLIGFVFTMVICWSSIILLVFGIV